MTHISLGPSYRGDNTGDFYCFVLDLFQVKIQSSGGLKEIRCISCMIYQVLFVNPSEREDLAQIRIAAGIAHLHGI